MNTTIQDGLFDIARSFRDEGQEVAPIAFFLTERGIVQLLLRFPKDQWRGAIIALLQKTGADVVIVHTEAWTVTGRDAPTAMAAKMAGLESLEDFPGRTEILHSLMECRDGSSRTLVADLVDGKLGPTTVHTFQTLGGEMVGFFKESSSGQALTA